MLLLMNNARLGVGFEALALSSPLTAWPDYAAERAHGQDHRAPRDDRRLPRRDGTDIQGMRALAVYGASTRR